MAREVAPFVRAFDRAKRARNVFAESEFLAPVHAENTILGAIASSGDTHRNAAIIQGNDADDHPAFSPLGRCWEKAVRP